MSDSAPNPLGSESWENLRMKARWAANRAAGKPEELPSDPDAIKALVHELRVHQIELEVQNEELRQSQTALAESERVHFNHYDMAPVGLIRLDEKGFIRGANVLAAKMLGSDRRILNSGRIYFSAYLRKDFCSTFTKHLRDALESGRMESTDLALRSRGGLEVTVRMQTVLSAFTSRGPELLSTLVDISQLKRTEEALRKAKEEAENANRAKGNFIAVLSHELRTPLTPVMALLSYMEHDETLAPCFRKDISRMRNNIELEARLIDDLLDVNRIILGKVQLNLDSVDTHKLVREAVEVVRYDAAEKRIQVTVTLDAKSFHVRADEQRLIQIFWNLLKNAIKFTPSEGKVTISSENLGDSIQVHICDTGIGLDPQFHERIFEPFEQGENAKGRFGGVGLGLAISRSLADLHGGKLRAESEGPGRGSRFTVELPCIQVEAEEGEKRAAGSPTAPAAEQTGTQRHRILLVEDDLFTAETIEKLLKLRGHEVRVGHSVAEALALAGKDRSFDLVISDLGLPDGCGHDLMRHFSGTRGIALSGYGMDSDVRESLDAGFIEHLTKPISIEALEAAIGRVGASEGPKAIR